MNKFLPLLATALLAPLSAFADVPESVIQDAFARIDPAVGLVSFSLEITNGASGERSKQDRNALGLVVSPGGLVLTHGHMSLENSDPFNVTVTLGEGPSEKRYDAEVLPKPQDVNVVLLQLKSDTPLNLPHVKFSKESSLDLGASVVLFGMLSESLDFETCIQERRVGAVLDKPRTTYALDDGVRFAFVGGPVIDAQGRIAGVVGFDLSTQEGGDIYVRSGHPLVYQTSLLQPYIDAPPLQKQPETTANDAWLGVFTQPLTEDYAAYWNLPLDGGLIVSTVVPGSPAGRAGLQPGDIITEFAGTPISAKLDRDVLGFTKLVRDAGAGKTVEVKFLRGGQPQAVSLLLETRPRTSQDAEEYEDKTLGMTLRELTADVKIQLNLADDVQGIIVRSVESGSAAQLAKIRPGVILLAFGDTPVRNLEEYRKMMEALSKEKPAEITVFARAGAITGFFRLQPRWEE
jgi:serine protease Do